MAAAIEVDTLQGVLGSNVWFHLDLDNDVLYLREHDTRREPAFGEESPEGFTILYTDSGRVAGMTVVNYWHRFGRGDVTRSSIQSVKDQLSAWAQRHFPAPVKASDW